MTTASPRRADRLRRETHSYSKRFCSSPTGKEASKPPWRCSRDRPRRRPERLQCLCRPRRETQDSSTRWLPCASADRPQAPGKTRGYLIEVSNQWVAACTVHKVPTGQQLGSGSQQLCYQAERSLDKSNLSQQDRALFERDTYLQG